MTLEEQNRLTKKIKSLKRNGSTDGEPSKRAHIEEPVPIMPIQAVPAPKFDAAAPSPAMPDGVAPSALLEQGEVTEKRKKKEKNAITKKVRRKVRRSSVKALASSRILWMTRRSSIL